MRDGFEKLFPDKERLIGIVFSASFLASTLLVSINISLLVGWRLARGCVRISSPL
jgi:hypothetical protein